MITALEAGALLPDRSTLAAVWRYLASCGNEIQETPDCLCRKIIRKAQIPLSLEQMLVCLDIFRDVELLQMQRLSKFLQIRLTDHGKKADLQNSKTMQKLLQAKES